VASAVGPHTHTPASAPPRSTNWNYSLMSMPKRRFSLPLFPRSPLRCCLELGCRCCCSCFSAPAFAAWHAYENWPIWRSVWLHFVVVVTCVCVCVCAGVRVCRHPMSAPTPQQTLYNHTQRKSITVLECLSYNNHRLLGKIYFEKYLKGKDT